MQIGEIEYNRVPILTYNPPVVHRPHQPIQHRQTGQIEYNRVPTLTYNQPVVQVPNQPIEQMQTGEILQVPTLTYKHPPVQDNQLQTIERGFNTSPSIVQGSNITQTQPQNNPTRSSYNRPIGTEHSLYLCTLCETPTKFADYCKLGKHVERFHSAFNQNNKGVKRNKGDHEESRPKSSGGIRICVIRYLFK